jgi:hypothetical protein
LGGVSIRVKEMVFSYLDGIKELKEL